VSACPDTAQLESLALGSLAAEERAALEAHLDSCGECGRVVAELARIYGSTATAPATERGAAATPPESASQPSEPQAVGLADTVYAGLGARDDDGPLESVVLGRYRLGRRLGAGGMGIVFEAHDPELHRRVAIKLLRLGGGEDAKSTQTRLLREARAMAKLAHPNVVAVHDVGRVGEQVFIAMELVEGTTLGTWLASERRSQAEILAVFAQAGRGLQAAHEVGLVHRDFKPDNVLIGRDGRARVTDFGLAQPAMVANVVPGRTAALAAITALVGRHTAPGALVGTPAYMAPEQWCGAAADARSDQFAFCVALHEALYGARPFAGEDAKELSDNVLHERLVPLPKRAPRWLGRAVMKGLAHDRDKRHASMKALVSELERDRGRLRRSGAVAAAMTLGVSATVGVLVWVASNTSPAETPRATAHDTSAPSTDSACQGQEYPIDQKWSATRRAALGDTLRAMDDGARLAPPTLAALDAAAAAQRSASVALCDLGEKARHGEAARACLDEQLERFDALVQTMTELPSSGLGDALSAVYFLPNPTACTDDRQLALRPAEPQGRKRAEVLLARGDLAAVHAAYRLDRLVQAPEAAERLVARAKTIGHAPLVAEAELVAGLVAAARHDSDGAVEWLEAAAATAASCKHEAVQAEAAVALVVEQGARQLRPGDAERWRRMAESMAARRADKPLEARTALAVGLEQHALGDLVKAAATLERALSLLRSLHGGDHPEVADGLVALSLVYGDLERAAEAKASADEARSMLARIVGRAALRRVAAEVARARAVWAAGKLDQAEAAARVAVKLPLSSLSQRHELDRAECHDLLGDILAARGKTKEALAAYDDALIHRYQGPERAETLRRRGTLLVATGKQAEGLRELERALTLASEHYGADDPRLSPYLSARGRAEAQSGHVAQGRASLGRALALIDKAIGYGPLWARAHFDCGELEQEDKREREALRHFDAAWVPFSGAYGDDHPRVTRILLLRADLAFALGDHEYAKRLYGSVLERLVKERGADDPDSRRARERSAPAPPYTTGPMR
jgi:tetratricopeptide (TPR) repeat protein